MGCFGHHLRRHICRSSTILRHESIGLNFIKCIVPLRLNPKSMIFTLRYLFKRILSVFISRWAILLLCRYDTPSRIYRKIFLAYPYSRYPFFLFRRYCSTELPPPYSMMRLIYIIKHSPFWKITWFSKVWLCWDGQHRLRFMPSALYFSINLS